MRNAIFVLFYLHTIELLGKLVLSGAQSPSHVMQQLLLTSQIIHETYKGLRAIPDSTCLESLRKALRG